MIRSMTGYGRGEGVLHDRAITVEVRAVNNRYLDCAVKIPRLYVFAEESIKAQVQKQVGRGKVDVLISIDATAADKVAVSLNRSVADGYYTALTQMRDAYNLKDDISVSLLSRFPDVFLVEKEQGDADVIAADLLQVLSQALEGFNAMREREGQKLAEDIRAKAAAIAETAGPRAQHFAAMEEALPALRREFTPGTAVLVKASHAMEFGKIVSELEKM